MEIKMKLDQATIARLERIATAMTNEFNDGRPRDIQYVAERALSIGIDELERIFEVRRQAKVEVRDGYEKREQQSAKMAF